MKRILHPENYKVYVYKYKEAKGLQEEYLINRRKWKPYRLSNHISQNKKEMLYILCKNS